MSLYPSAGDPPSEATIEQLANHQLLNVIGPYTSWFFVPTRNEEKTLGYDASLQGHKALVIQYKRLNPNAARTGGRISIAPAQHNQLIQNFPRSIAPYAFYAFAKHPSYFGLTQQFTSGRGIDFGREMVFVDVHSIPTGRKSISTDWLSRTSTPHHNLYDIAASFLQCTVGLRGEQVEGLSPAPEEQRSHTIGRIFILWARVS